jgi:DNA-binding XRE family transcriptional regulator
MSKTLIVATVVGTYLETLMSIEKKSYEENFGVAIASACLAGTATLPITLLAVHTLPPQFKWTVPVALYGIAAYHANRFKPVE